MREETVMVMRTAAAVLLLLAAGCASGTASGYDEAAHRQAAEAYHGTVDDWGTYRDAAGEVCDAEDLGVYVLGWTSENNNLGPLVLAVHYRCPERMGDLAPLLAEHGM